MRVLLVDDEAVTRRGLLEHIPWDNLGIDEIITAEDGAHALSIASAKRPDILLTDIRMPHIDGICLADKLLELYPSCRIIFLSGYSDKDYLKAAIRLKAIQYIEKPVILPELVSALKETTEAIRQQQKSEQMVQLQSSPIQRLASLFLHELSLTEYQEALQKSGFAADGFTYFTTLLIHTSTDLFTLPQESFHSLQLSVAEYLQRYGWQVLPLLKRSDLLLYHIFMPGQISDRQLKHNLEGLMMLLEGLKPFQIICGSPVDNARCLFQSYQSAVIFMQNGFFFEKNTLLFFSDLLALPAHAEDLSAIPETIPETDLKYLLQEKNSAKLRSFSDSLYASLYHNMQKIPGRIKELYYKLMLEVQSCLEEGHLPAAPKTASPLMERLHSCFTLEELHQLFDQQLQLCLDRFLTENIESELISRIKQYIQTHYSDEALSIQDISQYVSFSAPYVCTVFKTETGNTLNQYITSYRMQKAKIFLSNPRNRSIADIAAWTGYSDSNYFGKAFKKYTGLSPSEYREQVIS